MNVKQGAAGKDQRHSAVLSRINTATKLEGTRQRANLHQPRTRLQSCSFHKSLFAYCVSAGFDFPNKAACECRSAQTATWKVWMSHQHTDTSAIVMAKNKQTINHNRWNPTSRSAPKSNQAICMLHFSQTFPSFADKRNCFILIIFYNNSSCSCTVNEWVIWSK